MTESITKRPHGGQTVYTSELAAEVCRLLRETGSLRKACSIPGMPSEATVRLWVDDDRQGFAARYARAREIGFGRLAEDVLEISDDGSNDTYVDEDGKVRKDRDVIERSRLRVDTRKWLLARVLPKVYGDKVALTGADGGPLQIQAVRFAEVLGPVAVAQIADGTRAQEQCQVIDNVEEEEK